MIAVVFGRANQPQNSAHDRAFTGTLIRRSALTTGEIAPKRTTWVEHGGIGSIWVLLFPAEFSYLAAGLEVFLIQELGGKLPVNKSR